MRIISGKLKGRVIKGFDISGTRPTMDRVKESVFAMIQDYLVDSLVLDLFAGSGNLGIEALSNGAKKAYFNDINKNCINIINENINNLNLSDISIVTKMDYLEALNYYKSKNIKFDLVFLDPPYNMHINNEILECLLDNDLLNNNSLIICETNINNIFANDRLVLYKEKKYGEKYIYIYKYGN